MSFLGPNMDYLKKKAGGSFSLKTICLCAIQMINNLKLLHQSGYIHRDIKPENFVIGPEANLHQIFLIDFGLSKKYINNEGMHIPLIENKGLVGTARYTSINSHLGSEQSRRDDLESLGYILIYLVKGNLPWQNMNCENRNEKFMMILEKKVTISCEVLCKELPLEFILYFKYVKNLKFDEKPNYTYLQNLFYNIIVNYYPNQKMCMDWCHKHCNQEPILYNINKQQQDKEDVLEENQILDLEEKKQNEKDIQIPSINIDQHLTIFQKFPNKFSNSHNKAINNLSPRQMQNKDYDEMLNKKYNSEQNIKIPQFSQFDMIDDFENEQHDSQINNVSNEWNEQQDENVNIQKVIISFQAKTVMMNKK